MSAPSAAHARALDGDGYTIFRGAIPPDWLAPLRERFERAVLPSDGWPVPRDHDWRYARLQGDEYAHRVSSLPPLLAGVFHILKRPFFLSQVEGREPRPNGGAQRLHRDDTADAGPARIVSALAFIDPFDAANGATRVATGTHAAASCDACAHVLSGEAGDVVLFDARLLHGGTRNSAGSRRRSLLITYLAQELYAEHVQTSALRGVSKEPPAIYADGSGKVDKPK